jgi:trans-aconitate methyltransferase
MSVHATEWDLGYFANTVQRKELPQRTVSQRLVAWELDERYYDGDRANGYGGFKNDGRWNNLVPKLVERFAIPPTGTIVDLGCKKGFILKAFKDRFPNATLIGIENHPYPVEVAEEAIRPHLRVGNLFEIPCADNSVSFLIAFSAIYMQCLGDVVKTLREIMRVSGGRSYITVGAYRNAAEKDAFLNWTLIGTTVLSTDEWKEVFAYAGYTGNVFFTTPAVLGLTPPHD